MMSENLLQQIERICELLQLALQESATVDATTNKKAIKRKGAASSRSNLKLSDCNGE